MWCKPCIVISVICACSIISFFLYHNAENEMRSQQFRLESDLAEMKSLYSKLEAQFGESQAEKQVICNPESSFPFRLHLKLVYFSVGPGFDCFLILLIVIFAI